MDCAESKAPSDEGSLRLLLYLSLYQAAKGERAAPYYLYRDSNSLRLNNIELADRQSFFETA